MLRLGLLPDTLNSDSLSGNCYKLFCNLFSSHLLGNFDLCTKQNILNEGQCFKYFNQNRGKGEK